MTTSTTAVDVVIAGGGIIGCSIAWRLASQGLRVAVCDAGSLGAQASHASAGMLAPGGEVRRQSEWAARLVESLRMYPAFVAELEEESGIAVDYRASGAMELAFTEGEWGTLERRAETQGLVGIRAVPVPVAELPPHLLAPGVRYAMHYPDDASVDPRELLAALRRCLEERGAILLENQAVQAVQVWDRSAEVLTNRGAIQARAAVLAAGPWSSRVVVRLRRDLSTIPTAFPVKGHLAGYALAPGSLPWLVRHNLTYVLQRSSGLTIAGSNEERVGFDESVRPQAIQEIHRCVTAILPGLIQGEPSAGWIGFRPATESMPMVRRWQTSALWLAYGHYRNGVLLAPWTASTVAGQISASLEKD